MYCAYRNLKALPRVVWSVAESKSKRARGKLIGHASAVACRDVEMIHATDRALHRVQTGYREVCQWLRCESAQAVGAGSKLVALSDSNDSRPFRKLLGDPKVGRFCDAETGKQVDSASEVILTTAGAAWYR